MQEKSAQHALGEVAKKLKKIEQEIEVVTLKINERVGSKNEEKRLIRQLKKAYEKIRNYPKILLALKMEQKKLMAEIWKYSTQYERCRKEMLAKM